MAEHRRYGEATTILFRLYNLVGDTVLLGAPFAAGDVKIIKDEGASANVAALPVEEGNGWYSQALTATEMTAARVAIAIIDQTAPQVWAPTGFSVETANNPAAQHKDSGLIDSGTAQAGTPNTITLRAGAPAKIDPGSLIVLKGGAGAPGAAIALSYAAPVITVTKNWPGTSPGATTTYDVYVGPPDVDLTLATINSVSGSVGSVAGDILGNLQGDIIGTILGNVVGTVLDIGDKVGYELSSTGALKIYEVLLSAISIAGSVGKLIKDNLTVPTSGLSTLTASQVRAEMDANSLDLNRLAPKKWTITGAANPYLLTTYLEDGITVDKTATILIDEAKNRITSLAWL